MKNNGYVEMAEEVVRKSVDPSAATLAVLMKLSDQMDEMIKELKEIKDSLEVIKDR